MPVPDEVGELRVDIDENEWNADEGRRGINRLHEIDRSHPKQTIRFLLNRLPDDVALLKRLALVCEEFPAERFKRFEVDNEPNGDWFGRIEPEEEARRHKLVKAHLPADRQLVGPIVSSFDWEYLDPWKAAGGLDAVDIVGLNNYQWPPTWPGELLIEQLRRLKKWAYPKPVMGTEYSTSSAWMKMMGVEWSDENYARFMAAATAIYRAHGVPITLYDGPPTGENGEQGLVDYIWGQGTGQPKLALTRAIEAAVMAPGSINLAQLPKPE